MDTAKQWKASKLLIDIRADAMIQRLQGASGQRIRRWINHSLRREVTWLGQLQNDTNALIASCWGGLIDQSIFSRYFESSPLRNHSNFWLEIAMAKVKCQ